MSFDSLEFAGFSAVAVFLLNFRQSVALRAAIILALNLIFAASFISSLQQALPLAAFTVLGYGAVVAASRVGKVGLAILLALVVILFVWLKRYAFASFLPDLIAFPYATIGLSYVLFRVLHLLVDVHQRMLPPPSPVRYFAYIFFFLSFVSGPIQRYEDFERQLDSPDLPHGAVVINRAFQRIVNGLFLVAVVTQLTNYLFQHMESRVLAGLASAHFSVGLPVLYAAAAFTFLIHLYLNFSGYMEMVIGVGLLCGFSLPENFNRPYLAANFLDLWSRWHITLSNWFKFYVFNTGLKKLAELYGSPKRMPYLSVIAFFITFGIMGVWHGSTMIFLCYGLFLGFGASLNKLYQIEMVGKLGRSAYKSLSQKSWYRNASRALTISYFAVAVTALWIPSEIGGTLVSFRGVVLGVFALISIGIGVFLLGMALEFLLNYRKRREPELTVQAVEGSWKFPVLMGLKFTAVILVTAMIDAGGAPEFVYKVF